MKQYPLSDIKVGDTVWFVPEHREAFPITVTKIGRKYVYLSRNERAEDKIDKQMNTHFPCSVVDGWKYDKIYRSESHYQEYWDYFKQQAELIVEIKGLIKRLLSHDTPIPVLIEVRDLLKEKD